VPAQSNMLILGKPIVAKALRKPVSAGVAVASWASGTWNALWNAPGLAGTSLVCLCMTCCLPDDFCFRVTSFSVTAITFQPFMVKRSF